MLYHVPSGSKSSSSGLATGWFFWNADRLATMRRAAIWVHANHTIVRAGKSMGTARPGQDRVQRVAHERHVGNAAYQIALVGRGLVRGQIIGDGGRRFRRV